MNKRTIFGALFILFTANFLSNALAMNKTVKAYPYSDIISRYKRATRSLGILTKKLQKAGYDEGTIENSTSCLKEYILQIKKDLWTYQSTKLRNDSTIKTNGYGSQKKPWQ